MLILKNYKQKTNFDQDERIKFVGTIYDQDLLKYIRNQALLIFHGHEVGGTNPGLLEALARDRFEFSAGCDFNQQVAKETVLHWDKKRSLV